MKNPITLPSFLLEDVDKARKALMDFKPDTGDFWLDLNKVPLKMDDEVVGYFVWFESLMSYEFVIEQRNLKDWGLYVCETEEFESRVDNGKRNSVD